MQEVFGLRSLYAMSVKMRMKGAHGTPFKNLSRPCRALPKPLIRA